MAAASSGIVKKGFAIEYRDLEPPRTGIFDGLRIVIDPDVGFEMQCFLLLHLFGHSVQWVAPSIEHKLEALQHTPDKAQFMRVLQAYEMEAAGFGEVEVRRETIPARFVPGLGLAGRIIAGGPVAGVFSAAAPEVRAAVDGDVDVAIQPMLDGDAAVFPMPSLVASATA